MSIPRDVVAAGQAARVHVRPARPRDLAAVAAVEQASFSDPWTPGAFGSLVDNPSVCFFVAEEDGRVVGHLVAWYAADEGEIGSVAVAAAARGRGIGALLVDAALAHSAERGTATVYLEVRESNAPARRLYATRGFTEVGRRRRYYRRPVEDALVLARHLAPLGGTDAAGNETPHRA